MKRAVKLTAVQEKIVRTPGNVLVSAGAGTGKTRVLVERFLDHVVRGGVLVGEILAVTFTEKAANEMKSRIQERLAELGLETARRDLERAYISTVHGFAARLLKEHPLEAGVSPDFRVLEGEESAFMQEEVLSGIIERTCVKGHPTFELLRVYGEDKIRAGVRKIFFAARSHACPLSEFFALSREHTEVPDFKVLRDRGLMILERHSEKELAASWLAFAARPEWDWEALQAFKEWPKAFSRRQKNKQDWNALKALHQEFLGGVLEGFLAPWRERFEALALEFETLYEACKAAEGVLDFDDLQIRAWNLLKGEGPAEKRVRDFYRGQFKFILVDEFQDTDPLQMRLVDCLASGENLFCVGDYKQSIYGFRAAAPENFQAREAEYRDPAKGRREAMLENFRSAPEVLDFVNRFFAALWEEEGFNPEALIPAAAGPAPGTVQVLVAEKKEGEDLQTARFREASIIAGKIEEFRARGVDYGNMAVLFQAMSDAAIYEYALRRAGIPYFSVSGRGFYHQSEIRDMMNLLGALENPLSDIALASALRSPLVGVTDETLFRLSSSAKAAQKSTPLYKAVKNPDALAQIPAAEKEKLRFFSELFAELLARKDQLRISELLDLVLERTAYELYALRDSQGVRRFANLKKLIGLARDYETHELLSLSDFLARVRGLQMKEARESEAQIEAEESGHVVRLMTIHAAKGLEFEVCILADLGRQDRDPEPKIFAAQAPEGYSFKILNELTRDWEKPGSFEKIIGTLEARETREWKRLFYVAATRAKTHLVLSGVSEPASPDPEKAPKTFSEMSSWMDWVMALQGPLGLEVKNASVPVTASPKVSVFAETKMFAGLLEDLNPKLPEIAAKTVKARAELQARVGGVFEQMSGADRIRRAASRAIDLPVSAYLVFAKDPEIYWRVYELGYLEGFDAEAEDLERLKRKSAAGSGGAEAEYSEAWDPRKIGTAVHLILEHLNFAEPLETLAGFEGTVLRHMPPRAAAEARAAVTAFSKTPLARELAKARRIFREIPFVLNERHGRIDGIMDVLFEDARGGWHVVDYKMALGDETKVRESAYDFQIGIYALAVYELLGKIPGSGRIHFLKNNWATRFQGSPEWLEVQRKRLRELQERILDFTAERREAAWLR